MLGYLGYLVGGVVGEQSVIGEKNIRDEVGGDSGETVEWAEEGVFENRNLLNLYLVLFTYIILYA